MADRTTAYAKKVVAGEILKGRTEYLCCKRHLEDMKRKNFDYIFDVEMAERAIDIANELTILEGTEPVKLKREAFRTSSSDRFTAGEENTRTNFAFVRLTCKWRVKTESLFYPERR